MRDPLSGSTWSATATVEGFVQAPPNATLLRFAAAERHAAASGRVLDIGCGAGRNAVPIALQGWSVLGVDLSWPMLDAAKARADATGVRLSLALARMDALPVRDRTCDLVIVHGIWNLARTTAELRRAIRESARVATPGAALFVFTFSRKTVPPDASPVAGERFVYTQFSGQPQCMLTSEELVEELAAAQFVADPAVPLTEHNLPPAETVHAVRAPVILEAAFRFAGR